ncbi:unnamed protein product [Paramecium octaurelia]|uniref:Uncharacterized protein n=1 Tax=Paramecium octaurelia TaxID=43137 RepID=A0A8S1VRT7_PAROT|nr:unnamed protein product [Paramecium octaurelia]
MKFKRKVLPTKSSKVIQWIQQQLSEKKENLRALEKQIEANISYLIYELLI